VTALPRRPRRLVAMDLPFEHCMVQVVIPRDLTHHHVAFGVPDHAGHQVKADFRTAVDEYKAALRNGTPAPAEELRRG